MKFILIPLFAVIISQVIKILIYLYRGGEFSFSRIVWEGFWTGKFPSSHAAALSSSFYLLAIYSNNNSVISFAFIISLLIFYGLLEDKKRQEVFEIYISKSNDEGLKAMIRDGHLRSFSGHTYSELLAGIVIGIITSITFLKFF